MRSRWIQVGPGPVTGVLARREEMDTQRGSHVTMGPEAVCHSRQPRDAEDGREPPGAGRGEGLLRALGEHVAGQPLDFRLLASKTVRE